MADVLSKQDVQDVLEVIKQLYLEDRIPWICGYSGGKDSTAIVQLVWMALRQIPKEKRVKKCGTLQMRSVRRLTEKRK